MIDYLTTGGKKMEFDPNKIYWQAHRGGGGKEAPDNTIYAMEYGWRLGGIPEADIRITADNVVVCLHDNDLARITDAPEPIASTPAGALTFEEIRKYDAGAKFSPECAGQRIPSLEEVFILMAEDRNKMLYADIKNYDAALFPALLKGFKELALKYDTASQIIVAGCDYELNCRFKEDIPNIKTMQWIGGTPEKRMEKFRLLEAKNFQNLDLVQLHLYMAEKSVDNWIYDLPLADLEYAYAVLDSRLELFPTGEFTFEAIKTLVDLGIKQFATDEPKRFSAVLSQIKKTH